MIQATNVLEKVNLLLQPEEQVEYVSIEKRTPSVILVLTTQRLLYSNAKLLKENQFQIANIQSKCLEEMSRLKTLLQSENGAAEIINKHFS